MIKHTIANFVVNDLAEKYRLQKGYEANYSVISEIVEGWDRQVYVVPNTGLKLQHKEQQKHILM